MMGRLSEVILKDKNDSIIEALKMGSETTERLQHGFIGIASHFRFCIYTYLEELPYPKIGKVS